MTENNVGKSGLRTLTQDEINTVSGGIAWLPIIGGMVIKFIIESIIHTIDKDKDKDKNMQNPNDPGMCYALCDPGIKK